MNRLLPDIIVSGFVDPETCYAALPEDADSLCDVLRRAEPKHRVEEQVLGCISVRAAVLLARSGKVLVIERPIGYVGYQMNAHKAVICVLGEAGHFLGAFMQAGSIICEKGCGDFAFRGAGGGHGLVMGDAGDYCAEELTGHATVRVMGSVRRSAGRRMTDGELIVEGNAGPFFCRYMEGGIAHAQEVEMLGETYGGTVHVRDLKAFEKGKAGRHEANLIVETQS